jgi:hypothetical protein
VSSDDEDRTPMTRTELGMLWVSTVVNLAKVLAGFRR